MNGSFIREFRISSKVIQGLSKRRTISDTYNYLTTKQTSLYLVSLSSVMSEDCDAPGEKYHEAAVNCYIQNSDAARPS
jgi:hypothetical protein